MGHLRVGLLPGSSSLLWAAAALKLAGLDPLSVSGDLTSLRDPGQPLPPPPPLSRPSVWQGRWLPGARGSSKFKLLSLCLCFSLQVCFLSPLPLSLLPLLSLYLPSFSVSLASLSSLLSCLLPCLLFQDCGKGYPDISTGRKDREQSKRML